MGVIMLSAISYITLSTGKKLKRLTSISILLGWGWLIATITANMLWCMPQFSLCFAALQKNLVGDRGDSTLSKIGVSITILAVAFLKTQRIRKQGWKAIRYLFEGFGRSDRTEFLRSSGFPRFRRQSSGEKS